MPRIFITGSADGLGQMAARLLVAQGHEVVLHGRSAERAAQALAAVPGAHGALHGDLSRIDATRALAAQANALGAFDAVIHNAGVGYRERRRIATADGLSHVFAINVLAPYLLTALMRPPQRLVYLSSGMHRGVGGLALDDLNWDRRAWNGADAYAESKFCDVVLALAVARRWPGVYANALEPGWVPTKMGGPSAPDDMDAAPRTQVWLAGSEDAAAKVSGEYFHHLRRRAADPAASNVALQDGLMDACARMSGVPFPSAQGGLG